MYPYWAGVQKWQGIESMLQKMKIIKPSKVEVSTVSEPCVKAISVWGYWTIQHPCLENTIWGNIKYFAKNLRCTCLCFGLYVCIVSYVFLTVFSVILCLDEGSRNRLALVQGSVKAFFELVLGHTEGELKKNINRKQVKTIRQG